MIRFLFRPRSRTLYLIRGVSGTGKSTLAASLSPHNVAADDYPGLYQDGKYQIEKQTSSHLWCFEQVLTWMQQGRRNIAVHNTFTQQRYIQPYLEIAAKHGYTVQIIHAEAVVLPDGSEPGNVHGVSPEILGKQRSNWESWHD